MKQFLLLLFLAAFLISPAQSQNSVQSVYQEGVSLFNKGDFMGALEKFNTVLQQKPGFVYARSYAARCKTAIAQGVGPNNDLSGQLAKIVIPELNFQDAPIGDVLTYLTQRAEELSGGKLSPNFIYKGTPEQRQNTFITLSLRSVPMTEAIRYIGQLSGTRFSYEEHAVIADPNNSSTPAPAPTSNAETDPTSTFSEPATSVFD